MATSGSLTTNSYDGRYYKLSWTRTAVDVANNKSTIKWTLSALGGDNSWYAERTLKVVIAGVTVVNKTSAVNRYTGEIDSGTITLTHNTDGSKSFSASVKAAVYTSTVNCTGSKTFDVTAIDRISSVSATNAYVGAQSTITIKRANSTFKHTLEWETAEELGTIVSKTTATSYKWTIPESILEDMVNSKTKKITIRCYTYTSAGKELGFHEDVITATAGSKYAPTLNPTVTTYAKTQELTGNTTTLINGVSEVDVAFNASGKNGATIKSKKVTNGTKYRTTDGTISNCTNDEFVFTVTDSRGLTTTVTKDLTLLSYVKPSISYKAKMKIDGTATLTASGAGYIANFGAQSNAQNWKVQFRYKTTEEDSYSAWTNFSTVNLDYDAMKYTASHTVTGLDYQKTYEFETQVVDLLYAISGGVKKIRAYPVWDWGAKTFHVHGDLRIDNSYCLIGKKTNGEKYNMVHINKEDNVVIGGGSYPPPNIYLSVTDGGNISASNGGTYYSLLGAAKAMATTYSLSTSIANATGYTGGTANVLLCGNCLRVAVTSTRSTAASIGNIDNEKVMTITITHDGKIDDAYQVSFCTGSEGGVASYIAKVDSCDEEELKISIYLTATTNALKAVSGSFVMPANIQLKSFL